MQENQAKLFETVVQFDPNILQSGGGSGLGLFISHAIMKRHPGGVIGIMPGGVEAVTRAGGEEGMLLVSSDTASTGSMFFIELDGRLNENNQSLQRDLSLTLNNGTISRHLSLGSVGVLDTYHENSKSQDEDDEIDMFEKVLVVEDSKFNRKMMIKALTPYAKEVILAEDGVEAVAAVRECKENLKPPYDVIFMDSLMPNMNGIDATKIILRELKFPNPIVAVTGNMLPDDVREFEDAGACTVLGKPLQLEKLAVVVKGT